MMRGLALLLLSSLIIAPNGYGQQPAQTPTGPPTARQISSDASAAKSSDATNSGNETVQRIKDESLNRSQVMETLSYLTDVIGPRLTGSPNMKRANEWTLDKLREWGLENAHLESWGPFGRGWTLQRFSAQVVEPYTVPLIAYPKAWSPSTNGPVTGDAIYVDAKTETDLQKYKGKLRGAIVLTGNLRELKAHFNPQANRLGERELLELANAPDPNLRTARRLLGSAEQLTAARFAVQKLRFFEEEAVALIIEPSRLGDGGTIFVQGATVLQDVDAPRDKRAWPWHKDGPKVIPQVVVAAEHYNRIVRMLKQNQPVKVAVDLAVQFHDEDLMGYNTIAEIPGTDLKDEIVMLGGHMDSWHAGTGATDNAAGVAVAMEAVRILRALKLQPRRTIRIALWSGEEQGLLGSRAYVAKHFATIGDGSAAATTAALSGTGLTPKISPKPSHEKFSAYFNLDNGTGRIRGVYLQGNEAVRPIFREWLAPFADTGASTLTISNTGGTDHLAFDAAGLPGFQFIQDDIEYDTRTHHSNQDLFDRIQVDDVKQAAAIMAAFVYNTAMRPEKLPRKSPKMS